MKTPKNLIEQTVIKSGLYTAAGLVGFFFFFKAIGLVHNLELRALNVLVLTFGVFMAIRHVKRTVPRRFTYLNGLATGIGTAVTGVTAFALFTLIYVSVLDPAFMQEIKETEPFAKYLNPLTVTLTIFIEGAFSGILLSYAAMQFYRHSRLESTYQSGKHDAGLPNSRKAVEAFTEEV